MFARALLVIASIVLAARAVPSPEPLVAPALPVDGTLNKCINRVAGKTLVDLWVTTKLIKATLESTQKELILRIPHTEKLEEVMEGLKVNLCSYIGQNLKLNVFYERSYWNIWGEGYLTIQRPDTGDKTAWQSVQVSVTAYYSWYGDALDSTILGI